MEKTIKDHLAKFNHEVIEIKTGVFESSFWSVKIRPYAYLKLDEITGLGVFAIYHEYDNENRDNIVLLINITNVSL